jgi:hypothetical protein
MLAQSVAVEIDAMDVVPVIRHHVLALDGGLEPAQRTSMVAD